MRDMKKKQTFKMSQEEVQALTAKRKKCHVMKSKKEYSRKDREKYEDYEDE